VYGDNLIANYRQNYLIFMAVHFFVIQLPDSALRRAGSSGRLHTRIAGAGCRGVPGTPGTFTLVCL
jgi:hypothetical protein